MHEIIAFYEEMMQLIIRYTKDKDGSDITKENLMSLPNEKLCSWYFDALAYYKLQNHYYSLDEVGTPAEGMMVFIRKIGKREAFVWSKEQWIYDKYSSVSDDIYK